MSKAPRPLAEFAARARPRRQKSVMDTPRAAAAAQDFKTYLGLCVLGEAALTWAGYARDRLPEFGIKLTGEGLRLWANNDPECSELLAAMDGGPETDVVRKFTAAAREALRS